MNSARRDAGVRLGGGRRSIAINVDGMFLDLEHAIRAMRPGGPAGNGGAIVSLPAVAAMVGTPLIGAYCASKDAVRSRSKAAANAFAESVHPIGLGQPSDVAKAVLYLASDAARWTTGAEPVIDDGATAM